jgi:tetratricopeptide (TPR) repeat protein
MEALDYLMAGRFSEAIPAYQSELALDPDDISAIAGLASSYMGLGDYNAAIPLKLRIHDHEKQNPDHPGQHLYLAVAYWCLEDRARAIELARGLCGAILDGSVSMAPDHAGGATFGLVLHYMALTAGDDGNRDYALQFLRKLNTKYDKRPTMFRYPVATVKQLLGEVSFEDALASASGERDLAAAHRAARGNRSTMLALGQALFHDGAIRRAHGDKEGCRARMQEVFDLGYQTEVVCWYLARHEATAG